MTFKIHFTINDYDDYYIITGEDVKDIKKKNDVEMEKRNLDVDKNNCWSEVIK